MAQVRYLVINSPKLWDALSHYFVSVQNEVVSAILHYGATNGEEPDTSKDEVFRKAWNESKDCFSWGDVIDNDDAKDRMAQFADTYKQTRFNACWLALMQERKEDFQREFLGMSDELQKECSQYMADMSAKVKANQNS
ncbi:MAG: hypothetical protein IKQ08_05370 [Paludibacteraceae bacterium]|nr:hypothetical protein [Paludibacteraceae bacterium]